jgi:DNA transformation protein and related proteins
MSVTPSYRQFVLDQLGRVERGIRARNMFGGVGLYAGAFFFALIDDDTVYFKVDETNRADFTRRGMGPFRPFGDAGEVMQYYELPAELLDEPEQLKEWLEKAVQVARRAKHPAKKRTS